MESKRWEPVQLDVWRGSTEFAGKAALTEFDAQYFLIKQERMPDGKTKVILQDKKSGEIVQRIA
jgi:hypothetical protein